jgi:hypothetical protein
MNASRIATLSLALSAGLAAALVVPAVTRADQAPAAAAPTGKQPVDFNKLKEALPATIAGLARGEPSGGLIKNPGMAFATASAEYGKPDDNAATKEGRLLVQDFGDGAPPTDLSDAGIKRVIEEVAKNASGGNDERAKPLDLHGRPALLRYSAQEKKGTVATRAGGRITVKLELEGVTEEELQKAAEELPLKELDKIAAGN